MEFLARATVNIILLILGVIIARGYVVLDMEIWPCEITIKQRHYTLRTLDIPIYSVHPGETYTHRGKYRIMRDGCHASLSRRLSWVTAEGPRSAPIIMHQGSFNVRRKTQCHTELEDEKLCGTDIASLREIPETALIGTYWVDEVTSDWTKYPFLGKFGEVKKDYPTLRYLVINPTEDPTVLPQTEDPEQDKE